MIFINLIETSGKPEFQVRDLNSTAWDATAFDATRDGLLRLGAFISMRWGIDADVSCSSDLDFPQEFGIDLTPDEIRGTIEHGQAIGWLDRNEAECGWFAAADER